MIQMTHVEGRNIGKLVLYALSTCIWCKKTRKLLDDLKIEYYYAYVDFLPGEENVQAKGDIRKWNPQCSFPTLVINDEKCIVGFDEEKIRELAR
jgi:glutaredoxin-like protein NrdH